MSKLVKRGLSLLMALCMMLAMVPVMATAADGGETVYLQPGLWNVDGARFAARWWNDSGESWQDMTDPDGDGIYECTQPDGVTKVIFCRMNGSTTENNWDNKWNQSADLEFASSAGNCYTVTGWNSGDGYWAAYTPPTYTVAGTSGLCGGNGWDPADAANDMSYVDGIWTKTYANVAAGQHEFKVVMNHAWGTEYPGSNYVLNLDAATDVTISFNVATKEVSVSTGHNYEDVVTPPTCTEAGYTTHTCTICSDSYTDAEVAATGHTEVDGYCQNCQLRLSYAGRYYIATKRTSGNYMYMTNDLGTASTKRYQQEDSGLGVLPTEITTPEANKIFVLEKNEDGTYYIYAEGIDGDEKYLACKAISSNSGNLVIKDEAQAVTVEDGEKEGTCLIHFTDSNDEERYLSLNKTSSYTYFSWYKDGQKKDLTLIPVTGEAIITHTVTWVGEEGNVIDTEVVEHGSNATKTPAIPEKEGYTGSWSGTTTNITGDTTVTAVYTSKIYILTITYQGTQTKYEVAYGEDLPAIATDPIVTEDGKYTFWYWADQDAEHIARVDELPETMPAKNLNYEAMLLYTGWKYNDGGRQFWEGQLYCVTGWRCINDSNEIVTDGSGSWYYFDPDTYYAATGITRVPYPADPINSITYGPNADDLANADKYGYTDATTSLFVFGEDGKFDQSTGAIRNEDNSVVLHYAINGQLPWHIGFVQVGSHVYYFVGANEKAVGDTYVTRMVNVSGFVSGGIYTFGEDGNMCRYDGITEMADGTLRYYDNGQLMVGAGLVKDEDNYIYVRSNGELVVNAKYWVAKTNDYDVAVGEYEFDENGVMIIPEPDPVKDGIYWETNKGVEGWFYYENGTLGYGKGLLNVSEFWYYADGTTSGASATIYVRSNGQLAVGEYYITNTENCDYLLFEAGTKVLFSEEGKAYAPKSGIVDGYYYENNKIAYGAGLIEIDGGYYYVRSNGQVVVNQSYWITNVNDTGIVQGCYEFDENGVMTLPETYGLTGIKDGSYYVAGKIAYGAGLIALEDGSYIYVRSNGQLATGEYWTTNHNGELPEGLYDFGENGILVIE